MNALRARLAAVRDAINARALRERVLLAAAVVVVLVLVWDIGLRAPLSERRQAARDRVERLQSEIADLRAAADDLRAELAAVDSAEAEEVTARLRDEIEAVDAELARRTARVISPEQMVDVLRDMVAVDAGLTLESLVNQGAEEVVVDAVDESLPSVYRHRVEVVVSGGYFALLAYLERLEGLDWQFQWDALTIETDDYPSARATISLSTLSLREEWIGV